MFSYECVEWSLYENGMLNDNAWLLYLWLLDEEVARFTTKLYAEVITNKYEWNEWFSSFYHDISMICSSKIRTQ